MDPGSSPADWRIRALHATHRTQTMAIREPPFAAHRFLFRGLIADPQPAAIAPPRVNASSHAIAGRPRSPMLFALDNSPYPSAWVRFSCSLRAPRTARGVDLSYPPSATIVYSSAVGLYCVQLHHADSFSFALDASAAPRVVGHVFFHLLRNFSTATFSTHVVRQGQPPPSLDVKAC